MIKCLMVGGGFQHQSQISVNEKPSKNFVWVRDESIADVQMFIDGAIHSNLGKDKTNKFAWVFESQAIFSIDYILNNIDEFSNSFELILTHNEKLLSYGKNFVYVPGNSFWIKNPEIHNKTKLVSMITSSKNWTRGHQVRFNTLEKLPSFVDVFGFTIKPIDKKDEGLNDYMFSIVIENDKYNTYFTEKLLDCFATGTIPIYWGCNDISSHFDSNGIIELTDDFDFSTLTPELYYSKMESIKNNFEKIKELEILEDWVYDKYFKIYDKN